MVRIYAGRLLVDMVLASAGGFPVKGGSIVISREQEDDVDDEPFVEEVKDLEDSDDGGNVNGDNVSESGFSSVPTEIASVCTAISITGLNPIVAEKVCSIAPVKHLYLNGLILKLLKFCSRRVLVSRKCSSPFGR